MPLPPGRPAGIDEIPDDRFRDALVVVGDCDRTIGAWAGRRRAHRHRVWRRDRNDSHDVRSDRISTGAGGMGAFVEGDSRDGVLQRRVQGLDGCADIHSTRPQGPLNAECAGDSRAKPVSVPQLVGSGSVRRGAPDQGLVSGATAASSRRRIPHSSSSP